MDEKEKTEVFHDGYEYGRYCEEKSRYWFIFVAGAIFVGGFTVGYFW